MKTREGEEGNINLSTKWSDIVVKEMDMYSYDTFVYVPIPIVNLN